MLSVCLNVIFKEVCALAVSQGLSCAPCFLKGEIPHVIYWSLGQNMLCCFVDVSLVEVRAVGIVTAVKTER